MKYFGQAATYLTDILMNEDHSLTTLIKNYKMLTNSLF